MMPVGSKWVLDIPSDLAYGDESYGDDIAPGETLSFDVELVGLYHEKLAQGAADLVKANGKEIISVLYYPPPEDGEGGPEE